MAGIVIIPVKSFSLGKQRLAGAVDPQVRVRLGKALAQNVASTVIDAGQMPLIVTAAPDVAEWATKSGFSSLPDPDDGLDMAARTGMEWALQSGSFWLVVHSDLPLIETSDIEALARPLDDGRDVIAPSADGGTSAIGSRDRVEFAFGAASFHRHLSTLTDPDVVARRGLLLDVDSPRDLAAAATSDGGKWIEEVLTRPSPAAW